MHLLCHPHNGLKNGHTAAMPSSFPPLFKTLLGASERQLVDQLQFAKAENEILRSRLPRRIKVTAAERARLVRLGAPLGSAIKELTTIVTARTFLRWVNGDGARSRTPFWKVGRPPADESVQQFVLRIARETGMGYTKIRGELKKLGICLARNTIKNIQSISTARLPAVCSGQSLCTARLRQTHPKDAVQSGRVRNAPMPAENATIIGHSTPCADSSSGSAEFWNVTPSGDACLQVQPRSALSSAEALPRSGGSSRARAGGPARGARPDASPHGR